MKPALFLLVSIINLACTAFADEKALALPGPSMLCGASTQEALLVGPPIQAPVAVAAPVVKPAGPRALVLEQKDSPLLIEQFKLEFANGKLIAQATVRNCGKLTIKVSNFGFAAYDSEHKLLASVGGAPTRRELELLPVMTTTTTFDLTYDGLERTAFVVVYVRAARSSQDAWKPDEQGLAAAMKVLLQAQP